MKFDKSISHASLQRAAMANLNSPSVQVKTPACKNEQRNTWALTINKNKAV